MLNNESYNITLGSTTEVLVLAFAFCNLIGRFMLLELAQGFGLVTPYPFSSRELGGVWA